MILSDMLDDVLGRIEEGNPPIFWNLQDEVYVQMVYALFETSIITGTVQLNSFSITLPSGANYFALNQAPFPKGIVAAFRMCQPSPVKKTTLAAMDGINPGWLLEPAADAIGSWFPLGLTAFGIYPQLTAPKTVTMDFIMSPVNKSRPYDGTEEIPFQTEYADLATKFAGMLLRAKEGGAEAEEGDAVFKEYMAEIKNLSLFQQRIDSLISSLAFGFRSGVNPRTLV